MKRITIIIVTLLLMVTAMAQTLNITQGSVTYQFPASQTGEMTYSNGTSLTVMDKTFTLSDITMGVVSNASETMAPTVYVAYNGTSAAVTVPGELARYLTVTTSGAHVSIVQSSDVGDTTCGEITYNLSGESSDGEFYLEGSYKATVELSGLTLTNTSTIYSGAPIYINNGKRIDLSVKKGTENTIKDTSGNTAKGCLYCKGHLELKGQGTLNIYAYGTEAHAIKTGDYCEMKNCTVNVLSAVKDGLHANAYFLMESGALNIKGVGDDGIQVELDGETNTGETTNHEDEDSGNFYLTGGSVYIDCNDEGIESNGTLTVTGGEVYVYAMDDAINSASHMYLKGGYVAAVSSGNDGLDANGNIYVQGATVFASCSGQPEVGLDANSEGGYKLYVESGTLAAIGGLERGASLSQTCYQSNSWSSNTWYTLYNDGEAVLSFKTPSSGGSGMVVSTSGTTTLYSGTTGSGTSLWGGNGYTSGSGGSSVSLSSYSGGNAGGGPGGGFPGGGFPGGWW